MYYSPHLVNSLISFLTWQAMIVFFFKNKIIKKLTQFMIIKFKPPKNLNMQLLLTSKFQLSLVIRQL